MENELGVWKVIYETDKGFKSHYFIAIDPKAAEKYGRQYVGNIPGAGFATCREVRKTLLDKSDLSDYTLERLKSGRAVIPLGELEIFILE